MKQTKILWAVSAAWMLMLGAFAPGCLWPKPDPPQAADWHGSLCAAPESGGEFCVDSQEDPAGAWNQATVHGPMPIQMWAKWPSDMTLDELVTSGDHLRSWFTDIDRGLAYVRTTQQNAESFRASMAGNLGALLKQAKDRQAELLADKPVDAVANVKQALSDKASAEKSPLLATIAEDKQAMMAVQAVFDKGKAEVAPQKAEYASLATQFTAYRATEAAEVATYTTLAQQASAATLDALTGVEQAVLKAAQEASAKPNDLILSAMKLSAQIQVAELSFQEAIAPHTDFLATHGAALPDMASSALRSLNAMLGYIQQRVAKSDATATSLLNGVAMRRQALVLLSASQPARDTVAEAKLLNASTTFQKDATARVTALAQAPAASANLSLPYLARRYDELTALLQLSPLCAASSSSWREAGCVSLREHFKAAETSRTTTLPTLIATGLATMRAKGVDAALLDAAQARLSAGDVKGAAILYDAAVRATEGT